MNRIPAIAILLFTPLLFVITVDSYIRARQLETAIKNNTESYNKQMEILVNLNATMTELINEGVGVGGAAPESAVNTSAERRVCLDEISADSKRLHAQLSMDLEGYEESLRQAGFEDDGRGAQDRGTKDGDSRPGNETNTQSSPAGPVNGTQQ